MVEVHNVGDYIGMSIVVLRVNGLEIGVVFLIKLHLNHLQVKKIK